MAHLSVIYQNVALYISNYPNITKIRREATKSKYSRNLTIRDSCVINLS